MTTAMTTTTTRRRQRIEITTRTMRRTLRTRRRARGRSVSSSRSTRGPRRRECQDSPRPRASKSRRISTVSGSSDLDGSTRSRHSLEHVRSRRRRRTCTPPRSIRYSSRSVHDARTTFGQLPSRGRERETIASNQVVQRVKHDPVDDDSGDENDEEAANVFVPHEDVRCSSDRRRGRVERRCRWTNSSRPTTPPPPPPPTTTTTRRVTIARVHRVVLTSSSDSDVPGGYGRPRARAARDGRPRDVPKPFTAVETTTTTPTTKTIPMCPCTELAQPTRANRRRFERGVR